MKKNLIIAMTILVAQSVWADDDTGVTLGLGYSMVDYSSPAEDFELASLSLNLGYAFTDWLAIEARIGTGDEDHSSYKESIVTDQEKTDLELKGFNGIYGKLALPNSTKFKPYLLFGMTEVEVETTVTYATTTGTFPFTRAVTSVASATDKEQDVSYGVGVDIKLSQSAGVYVEYANWYDKDDVELSGFSVGFTKVF